MSYQKTNKMIADLMPSPTTPGQIYRPGGSVFEDRKPDISEIKNVITWWGGFSLITVIVAIIILKKIKNDE